MGAAIAHAVARRGGHIVLSYRTSRASADESAKELRLQGAFVHVVRCDLEKGADLRKTVQEIGKRFKRLDGLVHLASAYEASSIDKSLSSLDKHLSANAQSAYAVSLAVAPLMRKNDTARIVHISDWTSASGRPRYKDYAAYYVSKVAVKGVVEALALAYAPKILINAIAPGPIIAPTGMSANENKAVRQATPLGRWGGAEEIAKAALFLLETDFVTGETIRVDGGRHLQ